MCKALNDAPGNEQAETVSYYPTPPMHLPDIVMAPHPPSACAQPVNIQLRLGPPHNSSWEVHRKYVLWVSARVVHSVTSV